MKLLNDVKTKIEDPVELANEENRKYHEEQRRIELEEKLKGKKKPEIKEPVIQTPISFPGKPNIDLKDTIKIPNTNIIISKTELFKGNNWKQDHYKLAENNLSMPNPGLFMKYFLDVQKAATGKLTLYDGLGNKIPRSEAKDLWKYFSSTARNRGNCWTNLDAKFTGTQDNLKLNTDHRIKNGNLEPQIVQDLETCLMEDCWAELEFNSQGLPTRKSKVDKYKQGENIGFWHPILGRVARFAADSDGADLYCIGNPSDSNPSLGVFACAEGTPQNIFSMEELPVFYRINGVSYRNQTGSVELLKDLLDGGDSKTQDEWVKFSLEAQKNNEFYVGDFLLYYAIKKTLFQNKEHPDFKDGVKDVRNLINKYMLKNWLMTLTRVNYQPAGKKDDIIHSYGMPDQYEISEEIVGPDEWVKDSVNKQAYKALLGSDDVNEINSVYNWLTGKDAYIWRVNNKPRTAGTRIAGCDADSVRASLGCNWNPSLSVPSLGVRFARSASR